MKSNIHELKCWPGYFQAIEDGTKNFEVRKNDRDFKIGDTLLLKEFCPAKTDEAGTRPERYTGRETTKVVTYMLQGGAFGIEEGFCVLSIK